MATDTYGIAIKGDGSQAIGEMKKTRKELGKLDTSTKKTSKETAGLTSSFSKFAKIGTVVAGGLVLGKLIQNSIKASASFEVMRTKFAVLTGSVEQGQKVFERLQSFASATPLQLDDVSRAATRLLAVGVSQDNLTPTLQRLGDLALGNAQALDSITLAYSKMQTGGRASLEDLNILGDAGVPIYQALADVLGVSTGELRKMITAGKVGLPAVEQAIANLTGEAGLFENGMLKLSETTEGKLSTLSDNFKILQGTIGDIFDEPVKLFLGDAIKQLQSFNKWVKLTFGDADTKAKEYVADNIDTTSVSAIDQAIEDAKTEQQRLADDFNRSIGGILGKRAEANVFELTREKADEQQAIIDLLLEYKAVLTDVNEEAEKTDTIITPATTTEVATPTSNTQVADDNDDIKERQNAFESLRNTIDSIGQSQSQNAVDRLQNEIDADEKALQSYKDAVAEKGQLDTEYYRRVSEAEDAIAEKRKQKSYEFIKQTTDISTGFASQFNELLNALDEGSNLSSQKRIAQTRQELEDFNKRKEEIIAGYEAEGLSQREAKERYEERREQLENKKARQEDELKKKQFEQNKRNQLAQLAIDTARALVGALSSFTVDPTGILYGVNTALIASISAIQTANILGSTYTGLEKGGIIKGVSNPTGTLFRGGENGKDEAILPLHMLDNKMAFSLRKAIEQQRYGGAVQQTFTINARNENDEYLAQSIARKLSGVNKRKVY